MIYNVSVAFQYQVSAEDNHEAAEIGRQLLIDDIEHVYQYERGVEEMVKYSVTTVTAGLDYDRVMDDIRSNS